jgi:hypothetical protein
MFAFISSQVGFATFILTTIAFAVIRLLGTRFYERVAWRQQFKIELPTWKYFLAVIFALFNRMYQFLFWGSVALAVVSFGMQAFIYLNHLTPSR